MVRALWNVVRTPDPFADFSSPPYDLGIFEDIAHDSGRRQRPVEFFLGGFESSLNLKSDEIEPWEFEAQFSKFSGRIAAKQWRLKRSGVTLEVTAEPESDPKFTVSTPNGTWCCDFRDVKSLLLPSAKLIAPGSWWRFAPPWGNEIRPVNDSPEITDDDVHKISELTYQLALLGGQSRSVPFASAPVRSHPKRTYDRTFDAPDPEGDRIPEFLAGLARSRSESWDKLKLSLERFGQKLGIFDEIKIRSPLGARENDPFQLQVRRHDGKRKGPWRNLADVGYGVSQVLPLLVELLRSGRPPMYLFQQPEVHLHPSAQAALGTIFCRFAGEGQQLLIETHSDHLLERVRMDVRDGKTPLKPSEVSILFFERQSQDVIVHSIQLDDLGNVLNAPDSYRRFFMEETNRSLGL